MSHFTFACCTGGGSARVLTICIICPFSPVAAISPAHLPTSPSSQHLVLFGLSKCQCYISTTMTLTYTQRGNERSKICQCKPSGAASRRKRSLKWISPDWRQRWDMKDVNQSIATALILNHVGIWLPFFPHRRFCLSFLFSSPVSVSLNDPVLPQPWTTPPHTHTPPPPRLSCFSPSVLTYDSSPLPFSSACHVSLCIPDEPLSPSCIMHECPFVSGGSLCNS